MKKNKATVIVEVKTTVAAWWAEELKKATEEFSAGDISIIEYSMKIKAAREVKNIAIIDAIAGHETFLKDEVTRVKELK